MVCASSTNKIQFFLASRAAMTDLNFSSNSPRYLLPANNEPTSRLHSSLPLRNAGTRPACISCARPSTMAVLPTPGSPTISTLALNLRANTVIISSSSAVRPIMGSSRSSRARSVRLIQCSASISVACWLVSLISLCL